MQIQHHYHEVRDMLEDVLLYIFRGIKERCAAETELVRTAYPSEEFLVPEPGKEVRLTFAEGQKLLREEGPEEFRNVSDDEDMSTAQEKALGALIRKKYSVDFYVLDEFPETARPFYTKENPKNPKVTNGYDFFMRGQEILSGGERIENPVELEARLRKKGVDPASPGIAEYLGMLILQGNKYATNVFCSRCLPSGRGAPARRWRHWSGPCGRVVSQPPERPPRGVLPADTQEASPVIFFRLGRVEWMAEFGLN